MNEVLDLIITVVIAVAFFTAIYKIAPFKELPSLKPKFALFPKYTSKFVKPVDEIITTLESLEFKENGNGVYTRGKVYGDFSAKAIKLSVDVNSQSNEIKVYASFFGILFDTGDLWQVTSDILVSK